MPSRIFGGVNKNNNYGLRKGRRKKERKKEKGLRKKKSSSGAVGAANQGAKFSVN